MILLFLPLTMGVVPAFVTSSHTVVSSYHSVPASVVTFSHVMVSEAYHTFAVELLLRLPSVTVILEIV